MTEYIILKGKDVERINFFIGLIKKSLIRKAEPTHLIKQRVDEIRLVLAHCQPATTGPRRPIAEIGEVDWKAMCVAFCVPKAVCIGDPGRIASLRDATHFCEIYPAPTEPGKAPSQASDKGIASEDLPGEGEPDPLVEGFMAAATALAAEEDLPADWRSEAEEQCRRERRDDQENIMH